MFSFLYIIYYIKSLYEDAKIKVMTGKQVSNGFETSVGVRLGYILSPTLFNLFLKKIMTESIEDLDKIRISCKCARVTNLWFADDIDLVGKDEVEIYELTNRLHNMSKRFGIEISKEKSKTMVTGNANDNIRLVSSGLQ